MTRSAALLCLLSLAAAAPAGVAARQSGGPSPPPQSATPLFHSPANRKARRTIDAAIAALGGSAYLHFQYTSGSGRIYTFDSTGQLAGPGTGFWSFTRFPDAERIELTKLRDDIYIWNGDKGWEATYRGVRPLKPDALRRAEDSREHSIDVVLRTWAADPQTLMIDRGLSMSGPQPVDQVLLSDAAGASATVSFDISSHLPVRVEWTRHDPLINYDLHESTTYGNYQVFGGIDTPMVVQSYENDRPVQQRFYQQISYAPLSNALFEPPSPGQLPRK